MWELVPGNQEGKAQDIFRASGPRRSLVESILKSGCTPSPEKESSGSKESKRRYSDSIPVYLEVLGFCMTHLEWKITDDTLLPSSEGRGSHRNQRKAFGGHSYLPCDRKTTLPVFATLEVADIR
jgi:hypothetical protein